MANVLIIDDDAGIRHVLRQLLEKEGHKVMEAGNGGRGVNLYCAAPADLVILDMLMPVKNGMETTLELTRRFPSAKIIAITGAQGDQKFLDMATVLGVRRTLEKPFDLKEMLAAVREVLQQV